MTSSDVAPTYTIDALVRATSRSRRNVQDIVRQYFAITGQTVERRARRNFTEMHLTQAQYEDIIHGIRDSQKRGVSYAEVFRRRTQPEDAGPEAGTSEVSGEVASELAMLRTQVEQLQTQHAQLHAQMAELTRVITLALGEADPPEF